jgi:hypothetical protein
VSQHQYLDQGDGKYDCDADAVVDEPVGYAVGVKAGGEGAAQQDVHVGLQWDVDAILRPDAGHVGRREGETEQRGGRKMTFVFQHR